MGDYHVAMRFRLSPFRPAFSMVEITLVITVMALISIIGLRHLQLWLDHAATRNAIAESAQAIARAREEAIAQHAITNVGIDTATGTIAVTARAERLATHALGHAYGVTLSTTRDSISFDVRGLGYGPANTTLIAKKGTAANTLTVSRSGRVKY